MACYICRIGTGFPFTKNPDNKKLDLMVKNCRLIPN